MCGCELHDNRNGVGVCTCLCQEHDQFFEPGTVLTRKAVRRLQRVTGDEIRGIRNRLNAVNQLYDTVSADLSRLREEVRGIAATGDRLIDRVDAIENRLAPPEKDVGPKVEGNDTNYWPPNPHSERESDGEVLTHLGTDARKWADRFVALFQGMSIGRAAPVDESLMVGWFANAIEAGRLADQVDENGNKWRDRAIVAERRMSIVRTFVNDNLKVSDDA